MLREAEEVIKRRSKGAEHRWTLDKLVHPFEINYNPKVIFNGPMRC